MVTTSARVLALLASVAGFAALAVPAHADGEVNIYSSRHYDTDERLYSDFTEATGIKINLIEGKEDELIERMKAEGVNSPADVPMPAACGAPSRLACSRQSIPRRSTTEFRIACATPKATGSAFPSGRASSSTTRTR